MPLYRQHYYLQTLHRAVNENAFDTVSMSKQNPDNDAHLFEMFRYKILFSTTDAIYNGIFEKTLDGFRCVHARQSRP